MKHHNSIRYARAQKQKPDSVSRIESAANRRQCRTFAVLGMRQLCDWWWPLKASSSLPIEKCKLRVEFNHFAPVVVLCLRERS